MFEKNLEAIDNQALKRRLSKLSPIETRIGISYCITPTNDYVILKDDVPIDDLNDPRGAASQMLANNIKNEMGRNDTIVIFGLGLGYLLDEAFNKYSSKIYIYEPDLNLMHFVLNNADMSEHLSSGRVFITNELDELINKISSTYLTQDKIEIVYLQNYAVIKNKELLLMTQQIFEACKTKMVDVNTITKFSKQWLINTLENISTINSTNAYLLSDIENKFVGQTALIAAAGPSLSDNITKILENRDKFVVIAVNKVAEYLVQHGINPDFVVHLDARNAEKTLLGIKGMLPSINCITDIRSDINVFKLGFKKVFVNFSDSDFFIKKLAKKNSYLRFYESGGSAATFALVAAIKLGFSKIIFAGLDLAFKDNVIYSYGETMNRLLQNEILVDNVRKNLVTVKSVTGENVYTREDYQAYIQHFATILKDLNYTEVYNITSFGAAIPGMKNVDFDSIGLYDKASLAPATLLDPFKLNFKDFIQEEFFIINNIIAILSKGVFSPALISSVTKSSLLYQYLQADVLNVLQKNFAPELAQDFIEKTKSAIKQIVEILQRNRLL